jgi:predicted Zn-dependent peptidase
MYHKTTLKNGLRAIIVPKKESLSVNLLVLVGVGSNYEKKEISGISHFIEHMSFKGTKKRPRAIDLSSEIDSLGAECNAFTSREYTGYYISCLPDKVDQALDILSDMYLNPVFDDLEIEKEKGVIVEEINRSFDNPGRRVGDIFTELMYGDSAYGWSTLGDKETLRNLNRKHFLDFQKKFYHARNTVVSVAGNFEHQNILKKIEQVFVPSVEGEVRPKAKIKEKQANPELRLEYRKGDQTNMVMGFRTFGSCHKDYFTSLVLSGVLGGTMSSRLFQKVREEMGAAYSIGAFQTGFTDYGCFGVSGGIQNKQFKEVIRVILSEVNRLKSELVEEKELSKVKDSLIGSTYLGLETPSDLASFYGIQEIRGEKIISPEELGEKIKAVTALDMRKLARRIFVNKNMNTAILGPYKNAQEFVDILTL